MHVELPFELFWQGHFAAAMTANRWEVKRRLECDACLELAEWCQVRSNGAMCTHKIEIGNLVLRIYQAQLRAARIPVAQLSRDLRVHFAVFIIHRSCTFDWETVH